MTEHVSRAGPGRINCRARTWNFLAGGSQNPTFAPVAPVNWSGLEQTGAIVTKNDGGAPPHTLKCEGCSSCFYLREKDRLEQKIPLFSGFFCRAGRLEQNRLEQRYFAAFFPSRLEQKFSRSGARLAAAGRPHVRRAHCSMWPGRGPDVETQPVENPVENAV